MHCLKYTLIILVGITMSCQNDKNDAPVPSASTANTATLTTNMVKNLPANPEVGGLGHYTFFSLKNNAIVVTSDSASLKWDIGFNSTTIITNSGSGGMGTVGVQIYTGLFDNLTEAPATGYIQDSPATHAIQTGSGNGWYNYNSTTHVISSIPGRVIVVRTCDSTYAKIEILSYYKDAPVSPTSDNISRYYTFRYTYQSDGSRKF
jgi:hypothetical protein